MTPGAIDAGLAANRAFARAFRGAELPRPPARGLAVVACMDARILPSAMLGFAAGDAHVIRNAGAVVTDDVVRSVLVSLYVGRTREVMVVGHTDCAMTSFQDRELRERIEQEAGRSAPEPGAFLAFGDLEAHVAQQVRRLRSHPWVPPAVPVRGFVFDVRTGLLREVVEGPAQPAGVSTRSSRTG